MIGIIFYQNLPFIYLYIIFPKLIMKLKKWKCAYERDVKLAGSGETVAELLAQNKKMVVIRKYPFGYHFFIIN